MFNWLKRIFTKKNCTSVTDAVSADSKLTYCQCETYQRLAAELITASDLDEQAAALFTADSWQQQAQLRVMSFLQEQESIDNWGSDPENYYYHLAARCYLAGREQAGKTAITDELMLNLLQGIKFNQFLAAVDEFWNGQLDNQNEEIIAVLAALYISGAAEEVSMPK